MPSLPDGYAKRLNNTSNNPFARTTPVSKDVDRNEPGDSHFDATDVDSEAPILPDLNALQGHSASQGADSTADTAEAAVIPIASNVDTAEAAVIPIASNTKAKAKLTHRQAIERQAPAKHARRSVAEQPQSADTQVSPETELELPEYRLSVRLSGTSGIALERERQRRRERGEKVNVSDVVREVVDSWAMSQRK
jgi:cytoskeletal protein RodZ